MGRKKKKPACQGIHARKRARQRFGITFGPREEGFVLRQIQSGTATFISKQSERISRFLVKLSDGQETVAVYDRKSKRVVTLLYPHTGDNREVES